MQLDTSHLKLFTGYIGEVVHNGKKMTVLPEKASKEAENIGNKRTNNFFSKISLHHNP